MVTYREPFKVNFLKGLKNFFTEILNCTQPIVISLRTGTGWDWLDNGDGENILISIDETEIIQCNLVGENFVVNSDFGYGYCYFPIPLINIETIFIGKGISENFITSPVYVEKYDLPLNIRAILMNEVEEVEKIK